MDKRNVSRETIKINMIKTDLQIEHEVTLDNIDRIASKIGIPNPSYNDGKNSRNCRKK